ncbi:hypothetical protein QZH41_011559, partial [Actinostola sp. cb2023]
TLYIRRRTQLLRENAKKEKVEPNARRQYLYVRKQLLSKRYGPSESSQLSRSRSASTYSKLSSFDTSFDSLLIDPGDISHGHSPSRPTHRRYHSSGSFKFLAPPDKIESPPRGVVPTRKAEASRKMAGNTTLGENYAFGGMYHIFDQHTKAVTAIKFAHDDKYRLSCSSDDATLSVCLLMPSPPSVLCTLRGHLAEVTDFDWSVTNSFILSASLDSTCRIWNPLSGKCLRVVADCQSCGVTACRFQPCNNNMFLTGNQKGLINVFNTSTGKTFKGGTGKVSSGVRCMEFESSGMVLWVGDEKGCIYSFCFDISSGRLQKSKRFKYNYFSLMNTAYVTDHVGDLKLKAKFPISQKTQSIRSSFCPLMSFRQGACVVTGSEDMVVYFFDVERNDKPCVNKLMGHSSSVLDVCWNYDESLLASCDTEGTVIVWKREQQKYNM